MTQYTDEPMKLGDNAKHLFPSAEYLSKLPVSVYRTLPDGDTEELLEFRDAGTVQAVVMTKTGDIQLQFSNGRSISASMAQECRVIDELKKGL